MALLEPVALLHEGQPIRVAGIEGLQEEIVAKVHAAHHRPTGSLHDLVKLVDRDGLPVVQIDHQALCILAAPTRPACHLRVFVGPEEPESPLIVLSEAGKDDRFRGHIEANGECLRGKEDLDEPLDEEDLHNLLQHGEQTRMVKGNALDQKSPELVELRQSSEGFIGMKMVIQDLEDLGRLGTG